MKTMAALVLTLLVLSASQALCHDAASAPPTESIVAKSNHMALYQGEDSLGSVGMTITDKQGRVRKRRFNMLRKDADAQDLDQKYYVYFLEPADVRKMVFMVHKHAAAGKDDDRWMYLPSLDLVKRIAASDKRTSFAGSDFLYEDISGRGPGEDTHELIGVTDRHYVLKNVPKQPQSVEFTHYIAHIDKASFLPMKLEYYRTGNRLYRVVETLGVEQVSATERGAPVTYATVVRSSATDLETGSRTEMEFGKVRYNQKLADDLFTERYLRRAPNEVLR